MNDLSTVKDFITQIKERMNNTSVLDRGYYSIEFLRFACKFKVKLIISAKVEDKFIRMQSVKLETLLRAITVL